ncbi:MAG: DUF2948 family protein [Rhodobacteraceae bacterium]|nr:DUF2948 family protein [Paracoccaceae bacterium]
MSDDARFEDGGEAPLGLMVVDADDLQVVSALVQDAVFAANEMRWQKAETRFALLLNRFRWEDMDAATRRGRPVERVQALLVVDDVLGVQSQGVTPGDKDIVLSLLSVEFEPREDGMGRVVLTLAGDGALAIEVEALNITLKDVTKPYVAPSRTAPHHS